jgi:O-antigen/teichoic acid export membrane protein
MFRVIARNFSILSTAQVAGAAIVFVYMAIAARHLGPTRFGTYILIVAYVRVVSMIVSAGVGPIAVRELARHRNDALELFNDIISMRLALGIASYVTLMAVMLLLGEDRELLTLLAIAAITLVLDPFNEAYAAYYTAQERVGLPSAYGVASTVLYSAASIALLLAGFGLAAIIVSEVVTIFVMTVVWTVAFRARIFRFTIRARLAGWWRLLMLIAPFAPIQICIQLNLVLNVILLGRLSGPIPTEQSVGYYGPPQSITNTAVMLVMSLRRVLIPLVTVRLSEGYTVTRELDVILKLVMAAFALPLLLGTSFMAPELISFLYGEHYAPSAMGLVVLGWAGALQIAAIAPETFLFAHPHHRMQDYVAGAFMSVLANAVVCILLIGKYGFVGAAAGAVAGRLVYFIYAAHYCRRKMGRTALSPQQFGDFALLLLAGFGVWYLTFAVIANAWVACAVAVILTLPLIAGFILHLRPQLVTRPET